MPQEKPSRTEIAEQTAPEEAPFAASARRLFAMLEQLPITDEKPIFYQATWEAEDSQRIQEVITMTLEPTGARRQEFRGKFARAQFKALYKSDVENVEDATRSDFVWCHTGPQPLGTQPIPDALSVKEEYGYDILSAPNVIRTLVEHANSTMDYSELLNLLMSQEQDISIPRELAKAVNQAVYGLIRQDIAHPQSTAHTPIYREEMFKLVGLLGDVNRDATRKLSSQLVSKLMRELVVRWGDYGLDEKTRLAQQTAGATLKAAVEQNVIPANSPVMDRILSYSVVYRYGFATEWLYSKLSREPVKIGATKLEGIPRDAFAHDYIMAVLDGRMRAPECPDTAITRSIKESLVNSRSTRFFTPPTSFARLFDMAAYIDNLRSSAEVSAWDDSDVRHQLSNVSSAFKFILDAIIPENPQYAERDARLNIMGQEIVDTVLYPLQLKKIAAQGIKRSRTKLLKQAKSSKAPED